MEPPAKPPSDYLLDKLSSVYQLVATAKDWEGTDDEETNKINLMRHSKKLHKSARSEAYNTPAFLGIIHQWINDHARSYAKNPEDIPLSLFTLTSEYSKKPPLLQKHRPKFKLSKSKKTKDSPDDSEKVSTKGKEREVRNDVDRTGDEGEERSLKVSKKGKQRVAEDPQSSVAGPSGSKKASAAPAKPTKAPKLARPGISPTEAPTQTKKPSNLTNTPTAGPSQQRKRPRPQPDDEAPPRPDKPSTKKPKLDDKNTTEVPSEALLEGGSPTNSGDLVYEEPVSDNSQNNPPEGPTPSYVNNIPKIQPGRPPSNDIAQDVQRLIASHKQFETKLNEVYANYSALLENMHQARQKNQELEEKLQSAQQLVSKLSRLDDHSQWAHDEIKKLKAEIRSLKSRNIVQEPPVPSPSVPAPLNPPLTNANSKAQHPPHPNTLSNAPSCSATANQLHSTPNSHPNAHPNLYVQNHSQANPLDAQHPDQSSPATNLQPSPQQSNVPSNSQLNQFHNPPSFPPVNTPHPPSNIIDMFNHPNGLSMQGVDVAHPDPTYPAVPQYNPLDVPGIDEFLAMNAHLTQPMNLTISAHGRQTVSPATALSSSSSPANDTSHNPS
ncbi:hypothetical protein CC1G_13285 [Coprinopsis cinerea okayama7|uniref:Uncharacterized protein n=1 Tax=Coprinopsis cinerea (strain Okayama-7 / 130 / ATCC MYA-4618 / FGSC 9003) TaxID=240176 RepID=A8PIB6_COPC7|nr:hypothetical protein CC1G_13285 [Coprinopsis cinerea okayama7\|eukprot:XP_001841547.2 hypothetical protein CC1G_13285 [Coprinopsis cinerea okayama7\